ncbi:MAG: transposase [Minisyncoccia bacterium]
MKRNYSFSVGEYYHIYNRGVDKRIIFSSVRDYNRFILLLYLCNSNKQVDLGSLLRNEGRSFADIWQMDRGDNIVAIGSYVLMPNHFHVLVKEILENGISKFMGKLSTGYSMYFNKKNKRSGSLFEGRFKATHANKNEYLRYLFSYIHLNPVKLIDSDWKINGIRNVKTAERYLIDYRYSSYLDYFGISRMENKIIKRDSFPEYFCGNKSFKDFTRDWLSYSRKYNEGRSFV